MNGFRRPHPSGLRGQPDRSVASCQSLHRVSCSAIWIGPVTVKLEPCLSTILSIKTCSNQHFYVPLRGTYHSRGIWLIQSLYPFLCLMPYNLAAGPNSKFCLNTLALLPSRVRNYEQLSRVERGEAAAVKKRTIYKSIPRCSNLPNRSDPSIVQPSVHCCAAEKRYWHFLKANAERGGGERERNINIWVEMELTRISELELLESTLLLELEESMRSLKLKD